MYTALQLQYLAVMGIPAWELRESSAPTVPMRASTSAARVVRPPFADWLTTQPLSAFTDGKTRAYTTGSTASPLLLLSDALPAAAAGGAPAQSFSEAGARLLDAMLKAIGQSRAGCSRGSLATQGLVGEYSVSQELAKSTCSVVLFFAQPAGNHGYNELAPLRDTVHALGRSEIPCVVTYHPDYLLLHPDCKREAWEDLKRVRTLLGPGSIRKL